MGWIEKKDPPHICEPPDVGDYPSYNFGPGSRWSCDVCGNTYTFSLRYSGLWCNDAEPLNLVKKKRWWWGRG